MERDEGGREKEREREREEGFFCWVQKPSFGMNNTHWWES